MNAQGVKASNVDKSIMSVSPIKRVLAAFIDLICVGVFSLGAYTIGNIIIDNVTNFESEATLQNKRIEHLVINSGLFNVVEEGEDSSSYLDDKYTAIITIYTEDELNELSEDEKNTYISLLNSRFDNLFLNETDEYTHTTKEKYDEIKKSYDGLFEQDENGNYYLVDNFDFKRLIKFYEVTWNKAFEFIQYDTVYVNVMNEINKIRNIDKMNLYLSISLVSLIFFLIVPLFSKYYSTLGKKILRIVVIDSHSEELPPKNKVVLRSLILIVAEILLSFELMAIPLMISFTCACFTKNKSALHDYPVKTKVVLLDDFLAGIEFKKKQIKVD